MDYRFSPLEGGAGEPISLETACSLKSLVLGSANLMVPSGWVHQSFGFSEQVGLGLVQHRGGPCGVLAAVQAHIIKENLPHGGLGPPGTGCQLDALCSGLVSVFNTVGGDSWTVVLPGMKQHFVTQVGRYKSDGVTERLCQHEFKTLDSLKKFLRSNARALVSDGTSAAICLLYSVILTRGIDKVKSEYMYYLSSISEYKPRLCKKKHVERLKRKVIYVYIHRHL